MALNSIAIKQIIGAWAMDSSQEVKWMCSQVENLQITQDGETTEKQDANGSTIFSIDRNKSCQISFDSSVLDLSLISALNGTERIDATSTSKIRVPYIERFVLTADDVNTNKYIKLTKKPFGDAAAKISFHTLTTDGSLDDNYKQFSKTTRTTFFYNPSGTDYKVMLPTDNDESAGTPGSVILPVGTRVEVIYEYEAIAGVQVVNAADKFPDAAMVRFLVLAVDLCDQTRVRALWITANNAKPQTGNTIGFNLEDTISVTLNLAYSYCDTDKSFYTISVADEDFVWNN